MSRSPLYAATALGGLLLGVSTTAIGQMDAHAAECALDTLSGSYLYWTQGSLDGAPYASSGIMTFDGKGRVALLYTRTVEREQRVTDGTYTIESNCSGAMRLATGTVNAFYVGPAGDIFKWVRLTGEGAVGGEAERVTRGMIVR